MLAKESILFIGIAGAGQNVLAQYLVSKGNSILGMDRCFDRDERQDLKVFLINKGIQILPEKSKLSNLDNKINKIVISPAIEENHPAYQWGLKNGVPILKRTEILVDIFNNSFGIGITGTSGKTTVTGMVGHILIKNGREPTIFCGDQIKNLQSINNLGNFYLGSSNLILLELDESETYIKEFKPKILLINNLDQDHFDLNTLKTTMKTLIDSSDETVLNADCENLKNLLHYKKEITTFGSNNQTVDISYQPQIDIITPQYKIEETLSSLQVYGHYNLVNAAAAISVCLKLGIPKKESMRHLQSFKGIRQRFEVTKNDCGTFIFDYAHNSHKIKASLNSAKNFKKPVSYFFQPHGYGPFKMMYQDLFNFLKRIQNQEHYFYILPIYDAGGTADRQISSEKFVLEFNSSKVKFIQTHDKCLKQIQTSLNNKHTVVLSGARDAKLQILADKVTSNFKKVS